jgi:hypothetical protein
MLVTGSHAAPALHPKQLHAPAAAKQQQVLRQHTPDQAVLPAGGLANHSLLSVHMLSHRL